jgi:hypothetical protein
VREICWLLSVDDYAVVGISGLLYDANVISKVGAFQFSTLVNAKSVVICGRCSQREILFVREEFVAGIFISTGN